MKVLAIAPDHAMLVDFDQTPPIYEARVADPEIGNLDFGEEDSRDLFGQGATPEEACRILWRKAGRARNPIHQRILEATIKNNLPGGKSLYHQVA